MFVNCVVGKSCFKSTDNITNPNSELFSVCSYSIFNSLSYASLIFMKNLSNTLHVSYQTFETRYCTLSRIFCDICLHSQKCPHFPYIMVNSIHGIEHTVYEYTQFQIKICFIQILWSGVMWLIIRNEFYVLMNISYSFCRTLVRMTFMFTAALVLCATTPDAVCNEYFSVS